MKAIVIIIADSDFAVDLFFDKLKKMLLCAYVCFTFGHLDIGHFDAMKETNAKRIFLVYTSDADIYCRRDLFHSVSFETKMETLNETKQEII